jgi:glycosyltransferase involved in cell wall biosynthesis
MADQDVRADGRLRIAIACPGIGLVQRGFERYFLDIFRLVRGDTDITLFKGGGVETPDEKVLTFIRRGGTLVKLLPVHRLVRRTPLHTECLTFALALLPHLRNGAFDIVHTIDPPLTRVLFHLRARLGLRFRLLYTEGCAMPPGDYPPADHTHQVAKVTYDEAVAWGHRPEDMTLLPCGFDPARLDVELDRAALRAKHGIAPGTKVILSIAALNRGHKRTDHLIDEVAQLDGDILLWMDGSLDHGDPDLVEYAKARLGPRVRITHVPSQQVGELYHLADVMPHAATNESFGLALVEAASCNLPVLAHDSPHFAWLLGNRASLVDMRAKGALASRLRVALADPGQLAAMRCREHVLANFAWSSLRQRYLDLYGDMMTRDRRAAQAA